jgi:mobilization protein NikA
MYTVYTHKRYGQVVFDLATRCIHTAVVAAPKKPPPKKPPRTSIINIRVTEDQKERFAKAAEAAGMDVSTFMRSATIEKIERRTRGEGA